MRRRRVVRRKAVHVIPDIILSIAVLVYNTSQLLLSLGGTSFRDHARPRLFSTSMQIDHSWALCQSTPALLKPRANALVPSWPLPS